MKLKNSGLMAGIGLATLLMGSPSALAQTLGTAESFAVLAHETVTNTHFTTLNGNLGVSPNIAVTGFLAVDGGPGIVNGTIHRGDPVAALAQSDVTTAYNFLAGMACIPANNKTGQDLGAMVLAPGVYCFSTSAQLTGTLHLDAQNDPNAVFVFQIGSTLTTAPNAVVDLINGAQNCNVKIFWQVGSSATLDTGTQFAGNILALASVTLNTGATLSGRALARTGAVTLDTNTVSVCHPTGCPLITLLPAPPLPLGTVGVAYNQTITASGGTGPYTFSVTAGALPAGLSLTSGGLISGMPTTAGTSTFTVTATDANVCTGLQAYTIVINPPSCQTITLLPAPPLPQGTRLVAYNQTITAGGGTVPYTFIVTAGALPAGLSLTSGGLISGTPTTAGTFTFTVTAMDLNGCTGLQAYTIVINPPTCPTITLLPAPPLPQGTRLVAYNQTITASGGTGPYTFSVTAGALPTGLLPLTSGGLISGTPTTAGTFTFTVTATDATGCTGLQAYTIVINAPVCPAITLLPAPPLPQGTKGVAYNRTITASGGTGPYTFSVTAGALPTGLLPLTSGGLISGTPTTAGTFTFTVTATDANGCTGLQAYTIVINAPACPTITLLPAPPLPQGTVAVAYNRTITASGGTGSYTFRVTAGALPTGLLPLTSGGLISGTPTTAGTFTFTVTATDANGCTGLQAYTIVINAPACPTITLSPGALPNGAVGTAYNQTVSASGGTGPYTFRVTAGALPTGLSPLTSGGLISGTPTTAGTFTFTVTATDANGCTGLQAYTIVINAAPCPTITLSPGSLPNGAVGTAYNQTVSASGGTGPYTFSVTAGSLPAGLSLTSGGLISGTPAAVGSTNFTIAATDASGCTGTKAYAVTIAPAPAAAIPTLSVWGLMMLAALLALYGIRALRRQTM